MSLLAIASTALELGPMAIRGIASLFGGSETAERVAQTVETVGKEFTNKDDRQNAINHVLEQMTPEQQAELLTLNVQMEKELTERKRIAAQDRQVEHHETQTTIRSGDGAQDPLVRRARPFIGVSSAVAGFVYVIAMSVLNALGYGDGADMATAAGLLGLAGTFMGLRHVEKKQGTAS
ncbi:hypothetical protein [Vibrio splendidus]|jgi:uncharacterized protein YcfJ|uniref:hypothetical protein n=1 Tax=Vibrio splendidus TaxID=29497 RepID=UPI000D33EA01|nr:hypothetical protein [Vibrio splendidus]PTP90105.1 hypothetical protein CWO03_05075 [Vibrio splendidus]